MKALGAGGLSSRLRRLLACVSLLCRPLAYAQSPALDSFNPGANNWVYALAVQANGKILMGGEFRYYRAATARRTVRRAAAHDIAHACEQGTSRPWEKPPLEVSFAVQPNPA